MSYADPNDSNLIVVALLEANLESGSLTFTSPFLKISAFFTIWLLAWSPIAIPLALRFQWRPFTPLPALQKLSLVLSLYAIAPFLIWGVTSLEKVSPAVYGIAWNLPAFGALVAGIGLGVAGVSLLFGLEGLLGWVEWQPIKIASIATTLGLSLGLGLGISAIEEPVFRGFLLTQLQHPYPDWLAAAIASLIFALLHLVWDGKQAVAQLPGLWLMGLVLVLARQVNGGNLGLACGLHAGWIWAMTSLDTAQIICNRDGAPQWMTGAGQPLAGGMGWLMLLLTGGVLWGLGWASN